MEVSVSKKKFTHIKYYISFILIHFFVVLNVLLFSSLNSQGVLYYLSLFMFFIFAIFFYIRVDFIVPWYGLHRRIGQPSSKQPVHSLNSYNILRVMTWLYILVGVVAFLILSVQLHPILRFYWFLFSLFFCMYNADCLFTSYSKYLEYTKAGKWKSYLSG